MSEAKVQRRTLTSARKPVETDEQTEKVVIGDNVQMVVIQINTDKDFLVPDLVKDRMERPNKPPAQQFLGKVAMQKVNRCSPLPLLDELLDIGFSFTGSSYRVKEGAKLSWTLEFSRHRRIPPLREFLEVKDELMEQAKRILYNKGFVLTTYNNPFIVGGKEAEGQRTVLVACGAFRFRWSEPNKELNVENGAIVLTRR